MSVSPRFNPIRIIGGVAKDVKDWDSRIEAQHNRNMTAQFQKNRGIKGVSVDSFGLATSPIKLKTKRRKAK